MTKKIDTKSILKAQHYFNMLRDIAHKAETWNSTSYKKATDELYALLSECYSCAADVREQGTGVARELNHLLRAHKIPFNDGTKLETKVVRMVFGNIGKRAHIYARVLVNAREQSVKTADFISWLAEQGGVEAVRKQHKGLSPAEVRAQRVLTAEKSLPRVKAKQLSNAPKLHNSDYVLALVQHTNGKQRIVGFCENITLVKQVLAKLADEAAKQADAVLRADAEREVRQLQQQLAQASSQTAKAA